MYLLRLNRPGSFPKMEAVPRWLYECEVHDGNDVIGVRNYVGETRKQ